MRKRWGWGCLLIGLLLAGCAAGPGGPRGMAGETVMPTTSLRQQAEHLAGVEVLTGEPLRLRYAGLFAAGAAVPLAGGVEQLGPLAELLRQRAASRWQLRVGGEPPLAQARTRLLQGYFDRAGVVAGRLEWQLGAVTGPGLELQLLSAL